MASWLLLRYSLVLAVLGGGHAAQKFINSYAGPFNSYTKMFYLCDPGQPFESAAHMRYTHFHPGRPSELQFMTGNVTIGPHGLDDTMWARVVVDSRSNNQWKENAFVFNFIRKACSQFRDNAPGAFGVFFNATDKKTACPVMTGTYGVVNAKVQWTYPNVPILPYGDYRVRLTYGKNDQTFTCLVSECTVIPKTA